MRQSPALLLTPYRPVLRCFGPLEFERTPYTLTSLIEHVRVDHCRRQIRMAEQFLNRADVIGRLQQVRGERVAEGMATRPLRDARLPDR